MSNRVYLTLHKVESINLDGTPRYPGNGAWYEVIAYDDGARCAEYIGSVKDMSLPIEDDVFTPGGAIRWIREHEDDYDGLADWALDHGMYIMDDWYEPEELMKAFDEAMEEED